MKILLLIVFLSVSVCSVFAQAGTDYNQLVVNASSLLKAGQLDEAKQDVQQAIKLNPTNYLAYAVAAKIASKQNDADEANNLAQKALELAPDEDKDKVRQLAEELKSAPPSSAQPPELSDEDRLTLNTLMLLLDQADQATTPEDRDKAFSDFLDRSADFAKAHPEQTNIWIMRAVAAIDLNRPQEGWEAGQHLKSLGLMHSDDPKVGKVFAELNINGWLTDASPESQGISDYKTGLAYKKGQGVPQDYAQALNYFQKAAAEGSADAEDDLGQMYEMGWGVTKDYGQALNWYNQAAAKGNAEAECCLGSMYLFGYGVAQDYGQALNWYNQAAVKGNASAESQLGYMYQTGSGVQKDIARALNWYNQAAAQGDAAAQTQVQMFKPVNKFFQSLLGTWQASPDEKFFQSIDRSHPESNGKILSNTGDFVISTNSDGELVVQGQIHLEVKKHSIKYVYDYQVESVEVDAANVYEYRGIDYSSPKNLRVTVNGTFKSDLNDEPSSSGDFESTDDDGLSFRAQQETPLPLTRISDTQAQGEQERQQQQSSDSEDQPQQGYSYTLARGNTLSAIAKAYQAQGINVTVDDILRANPGLNPNQLRAGRKIFIPTPQ